jgi:hypothetical protein
MRQQTCADRPAPTNLRRQICADRPAPPDRTPVARHAGRAAPAEASARYASHALPARAVGTACRIRKPCRSRGLGTPTLPEPRAWFVRILASPESHEESHRVVMRIIPTIVRHHAGGMAEWLKAHAWKACIRETVSWVRIPLPPPTPSFALIRSDPRRSKIPNIYRRNSARFPLDTFAILRHNPARICGRDCIFCS